MTQQQTKAKQTLKEIAAELAAQFTNMRKFSIDDAKQFYAMTAAAIDAMGEPVCEAGVQRAVMVLKKNGYVK